MMLDSSLEKYFQEQMNRERLNAATYDHIAGIMETIPWDGFAKWCRKAAAEEFEHYRKFNDFLVDRNCTPKVVSTPEPSSPSFTLPAMFAAIMKLETENTTCIEELVTYTKNAGDEDAENWLIWALEEQRNAEREIKDIINQIKLAGDNYAALLALDEKYGEG
jgi:ferritin